MGAEAITTYRVTGRFDIDKGMKDASPWERYWKIFLAYISAIAS